MTFNLKEWLMDKGHSEACAEEIAHGDGYPEEDDDGGVCWCGFPEGWTTPSLEDDATGERPVLTECSS